MPEMRVLNVGGGDKSIPIPQIYAGWEHVLLDINPRLGVDIVADARHMGDVPALSFDAVYCAHNLEHYYRHDVDVVLRSFVRVLKDTGFAHIRVPNVHLIMRDLIARGRDIDDTVYVSPSGPITYHNILMGYDKEIADTGNDFYAHKTAFTPPLLGRVLRNAGFHKVTVFSHDNVWEIEGYAYMSGSAGSRL